jgi:transposase
MPRMLRAAAALHSNRVPSNTEGSRNETGSVEELLLVVQARDAEIDMLKLLVQKLKLQLARRNRMVFGSSSERFVDPAQNPQGTLLEGVVLDELPVKKAASTPVSQAANSPSIDRSLPDHLPREQHVHRPGTTSDHHDTAGQPCGCLVCGGRLREIGRDVSEQPEYVPARFKVVRHVRPKLACVSCQSIFQASAPSRPIARGLPGPALMAHVMVSKYCDHQPLYRQSVIYARSGIELDRSTLAGWVGKGDELLDPLVAAIHRYGPTTRSTATTRR